MKKIKKFLSSEKVKKLLKSKNFRKQLKELGKSYKNLMNTFDINE